MKDLPGNISKVIKMFNPTDMIKDSTLSLMSHIIANDFLKRRGTHETSVVRNTFIEESYPYFYAGLHEKCLISNFYTCYDR